MEHRPIRPQEDKKIVLTSLMNRLTLPEFKLRENQVVKQAYQCICIAIADDINSLFTSKLILPTSVQGKAIVALYFDWLNYERDIDDLFTIPLKSNDESLQSESAD